MNFSFGIKNGMCFGIDLTSVTDDIIVSPDDCEYQVNGIVITVACFYLIFGEFTPIEVVDER